MKTGTLSLLFLFSAFCLKAQLANNDDDFRTERIKYLQSELSLDDATVAELTRRFAMIEPEHSAADWKKTRLAYEQVLREVLGIDEQRKLAETYGFERECFAGKVNGRASSNNTIKSVNTLSIAPNPTDYQTTITYEVGAAGNISIALNDELGNHLSTIINAYHEKGEYKKDLDMSDYPSSVYLVIMRDGRTIVTKKLVIQK